MKKLAGYTQIKTSAGRPLFARTEISPLMERVIKEYRTDYHMTSFMRTLMTLNADAMRGNSLNPAGDERSITCGHISMRYSLFDGVVLIDVLAISRPQSTKKVGLYKIEYHEDRGQWLREGESTLLLDKNQQWKSQDKQAHYAAVAGRFGRLTDAAKHMPEHIIGGYEKAHYLTRHDKGNQYSGLKRVHTKVRTLRNPLRLSCSRAPNAVCRSIGWFMAMAFTPLKMQPS